MILIAELVKGHYFVFLIPMDVLVHRGIMESIAWQVNIDSKEFAVTRCTPRQRDQNRSTGTNLSMDPYCIILPLRLAVLYNV